MTRPGPRVQEGGPSGQEEEEEDLSVDRRGDLQVTTDYHDTPNQRQRPCVHGTVFQFPGDDDDHMGR